jgi:hypothetical protein
VKRLVIRGKRWKVAISRLPINNADATCDYTNRVILISPSTKDKKSAMFHEILHACLPDLEELAVCEIELALLDGEKALSSLHRNKR